MTTKVEIVTDMESAAFSGNWDKFKTYLSDDVYYRVGNTAEIRGSQAVVDYLINMFATKLAINDVQVRSAWEIDDVVILEFNMGGMRVRDKKQVAFPCLDIYRFDGSKICDWRVFAIEPTYVQ